MREKIRGSWQRSHITYCACCTAELSGAGHVAADENAEDKLISPLMTTPRFVNLHFFCGLLLKLKIRKGRNESPSTTVVTAQPVPATLLTTTHVSAHAHSHASLPISCAYPQGALYVAYAFIRCHLTSHRPRSLIPVQMTAK